MTDTNPIDFLATARTEWGGAQDVPNMGERYNPRYTRALMRASTAAEVSIAQSLAGILALQTRAVADSTPTKVDFADALRQVLGEPVNMTGPAEQPVDIPAPVQAASAYVRAVKDRPDFSGFFSVDMVDAFLAGVDWVLEQDEDGWVPTPEDSAFALLHDRHYTNGAVTSVTLTISPADADKIIGWGKGGGITLSPAVIVRA